MSSTVQSQPLWRRPSAIRLRRQSSTSSIKSPLSSPLFASFTPDPALLNPGASVALTDAPPETPPSTPPCSGGYFNILAPPPITQDGGVGFGGGRRLVRRNSSLSIASSMGSDGEEENNVQWTEGDEDKIKRTIDMFLAASSTTGSPFSGAPPSNLCNVIARAVVNNKVERVLRSNKRGTAAHDSSDASSSERESEPKWKHSIKSTRAKILKLVRERETSGEDTPRQGDLEATPKRRKPAGSKMVRQNSMDFLGPASRNVGVVARLGSKLQRAEQGPPPSHPYLNAPRSSRLQRTNSLSSIAGSPTQPKPDPAPTRNLSLRPGAARMLRVASDHSAGVRPRDDLYSWSAGVTQANTPLFAPAGPSSAASSLLGLAFDEFPPAPKRKQAVAPGNGLASAFHSPISALYPSPVSLKKQKKEHHSEPEEDGEDLPMSPLAAPLDFVFSSTLTVPTPSRLVSRNDFYLSGGNDSDMSVASVASFDSEAETEASSTWAPSLLFPSDSSASSAASIDYSSSSTSLASVDTLNMSIGTSPASSTLNLHELSIAAPKNGTSAFLDEAYVRAGLEGKGPAPDFGGWSWGAKARGEE